MLTEIGPQESAPELDGSDSSDEDMPALDSVLELDGSDSKAQLSELVPNRVMQVRRHPVLIFCTGPVLLFCIWSMLWHTRCMLIPTTTPPLRGVSLSILLTPQTCRRTPFTATTLVGDCCERKHAEKGQTTAAAMGGVGGSGGGST